MSYRSVRYVLALSAALFVFHAPAMASSDELADIRNQLHDLLLRVDRLERENNALKAQNETLQADGEHLKSESRQLRERFAAPAAQVNKDKADGWTERVTLKGDLRYRHEQIRDDTQNAAGVRVADRYRDRIRARLSAQAQATDDVSIGIGFATAEDNDPRSSNQTLGDLFSRKSIDLDLAYFDWSLADWGHFIGGKMKQPFFKPGRSLFWDNDLNPEGIAVTLKRGALFGTAYSYWLDEVSGPQGARTSDTMLFGGQIGAQLPLGESNLILAAHYYDLSGGQGRAPFFDGDPNGNTTVAVGTPPSMVLLNDYRVVDLMAEFNSNWDAPWGTVPLQIWTDIAQNGGANNLEMAWAAGVMFGYASNARTWELGAEYHSIEKDALFAQLIDADLGGGRSDTAGWILRAGYAPVKNVALNATYFINKRNVDVANAAGQIHVGYDRLQLDVNMKF